MNKAQKKPLQLQDSLAVRILICVLFPLIAFAGLLLSQGKSPLVAYQTIITSIFGSAYGFGEVIVRASYLILTGLAASIPAATMQILIMLVLLTIMTVGGKRKA